MNKYQNTSEHRRVWPGIQTADGATLELDAGETVELEDTYDDVNLKPISTKKLTKFQEEKAQAEADAKAAEKITNKETQS